MKSLDFLNVALTMAFVLLLAALQTGLWTSVIRSVSPPLFWLPVITYLFLYRKSNEGIIVSYLAALVLSVFTVSPVGYLFVVFLALSFLLRSIKERMFWSGPYYFTLMVVVTICAFHFLQIVVVWLWDATLSVTSGNLLEILAQCLTTPLLALPVYRLLDMIDNYTQKEPVIELGQRG